MEDIFFKFNSGTVAYRSGSMDKVLAENVAFELEQGESLALIGETGSGKTMTALDIMDLLPENVYAENRIRILDGVDLEKLPGKEMHSYCGKTIVYIPQNGADYLNPSRKIGRQLLDNLKNGGRSAAAEKLRLAGLDDAEEFLDRYPFQLSGGQNQRVTIALALCGDPKLLIADEPTNGLDQKNREDFLDNLDKLFPKAAKIIITHDIGVARHCSRIVVLRGGHVMEEGCCKDVLSDPKSEYTKALMSSLVENGMKNAL